MAENRTSYAPLNRNVVEVRSMKKPGKSRVFQSVVKAKFMPWQTSEPRVVGSNPTGCAFSCAELRVDAK